MQGHEDIECRVLHPELRTVNIKNDCKGKQKMMEEVENGTKEISKKRFTQYRKHWNPTHTVFTRESNSLMNDKAKTLERGFQLITHCRARDR